MPILETTNHSVLNALMLTSLSCNISDPAYVHIHVFSSSVWYQVSVPLFFVTSFFLVYIAIGVARGAISPPNSPRLTGHLPPQDAFLGS